MAELKDLVGIHLLTGVDFGTGQHWEDGEFTERNVIRFRLNEVIYVAYEDAQDGYRSSMRELKMDSSVPMKNIFEAVTVTGHYDKINGSSILALFDEVTGDIVLEVGTNHFDDYYPYFVSSFHPENMSINRVAAKKEEAARAKVVQAKIDKVLARKVKEGFGSWA